MGFSGMFSNSCIFAKFAKHLCGLYNPRGNTVWKVRNAITQTQNSHVPKVCHYVEFLPSKSEVPGQKKPSRWCSLTSTF